MEQILFKSILGFIILFLLFRVTSGKVSNNTLKICFEFKQAINFRLAVSNITADELKIYEFEKIDRNKAKKLINKTRLCTFLSTCCGLCAGLSLLFIISSIYNNKISHTQIGILFAIIMFILFIPFVICEIYRNRLFIELLTIKEDTMNSKENENVELIKSVKRKPHQKCGKCNHYDWYFGVCSAEKNGAGNPEKHNLRHGTLNSPTALCDLFKL